MLSVLVGVLFFTAIIASIMDGEWAAIGGAPLGILFLAYGIFKIDMTKK